MRRCVDNVDERLKLFPHCTHVNVRPAAAADAVAFLFPFPLSVTLSRRHLGDVMSRE